MKRTRKALFANSRLPGQQHRHLGGRGLAQQLDGARKARRTPDQRAQFVLRLQLRTQRLDLLLESAQAPQDRLGVVVLRSGLIVGPLLRQTPLNEAVVATTTLAGHLFVVHRVPEKFVVYPGT